VTDELQTHTTFVAGATGYTGQEVVAACRRRGWRTVAHVRPGSPGLERRRAAWEAAGVEVDATPWDPAAMTATLARVAPTVVFALLGTTRRRAESEGMAAVAAYRQIDFGLTALLVEAAAALRNAPRFVYLSSLGAGAAGGNAYLRARADAEAKLRESALPWTIARPSLITGPDRGESRPLERAAAAAADGALALAGLFGARRLRDSYRSIDAPALAAALVTAAADPRFAGRVLEAADLQALTAAASATVDSAS
jgi:nucleoside-diphosphate-sugar epimerase